MPLKIGFRDDASVISPTPYIREPLRRNGESLRPIQRPFAPKRSTKGRETGTCVEAYNHPMALAATAAATWLIDDTVGELVAEIRHSCSAPEAHQLTPTVTNHRRATP
jgi:hypothetical protein